MRNIKNKKLVAVLMATTLFFGGCVGGYAYIQNNNLITETQKTYHSLSIQNVEHYNDEEKSEYDRLEQEKNAAFNSLDVRGLSDLQAKYDELHAKVADRIAEEERMRVSEENITIAMAQKQEILDAIESPSGATDNEWSVLNTARDQAQTEIHNRNTDYAYIDELLEVLRGHVTNVHDAITERNRPVYSPPATTSGGGGNYYTPPSSSGGGNYTPPSSGGGQTPVTPPTPKEECRKMPDGSTRCSTR